MSKYNTINNNKYLQKPDVIQKNMHTSSVPTKYVAQPIKTNTIQKNLHGLPVQNKYSNSQSDKFISKKSMYFQKSNLLTTASRAAHGLKEIERLKGLGHSVEDAWKTFVSTYSPTQQTLDDMVDQSSDFFGNPLLQKLPEEFDDVNLARMKDQYDVLSQSTTSNPKIEEAMFQLNDKKRGFVPKEEAVHQVASQYEADPFVQESLISQSGLSPEKQQEMENMYVYGSGRPSTQTTTKPRRNTPRKPPKSRNLTQEIDSNAGFLTPYRHSSEINKPVLDEFNLKILPDLNASDSFNSGILPDLNESNVGGMSEENIPQITKDQLTHFLAYDKPEPSELDLFMIEQGMDPLALSEREYQYYLNNPSSATVPSVQSYDEINKPPIQQYEFLRDKLGVTPIYSSPWEAYGIQSSIRNRTNNAQVNQYDNISQMSTPINVAPQFKPKEYDDGDQQYYNELLQELKNNPKMKKIIEQIEQDSRGDYEPDALLDYARLIMNDLG